MKKQNMKIIFYAGIPLALIVFLAVFAFTLLPGSGITGRFVDSVPFRLSQDEVFDVGAIEVIVPSGTQINCSAYSVYGPNSGSATFVSQGHDIKTKRISMWKSCHNGYLENLYTEKYFTGDIRFYYTNYDIWYTAKSRFMMLSSCDDVVSRVKREIVTPGNEVECTEIIERKTAQYSVPFGVDDFDGVDSEGRGFNTVSVSDICGYDEANAFFQPDHISEGNPGINQPWYSGSKLSGHCVKIQKTIYKTS